MAGALTIVVTRPGEAGRALAEALQRQGRQALWLPAFEFGPPPDPDGARATLARLSDFDLAVFVSPQAAQATAALLAAPWPEATTIAAVGSGTRAAVRSAIDGAGRGALLAPPDDGDIGRSGSEALWPLLQTLRPPPRKVLLLRAQGGREWLAERLAQAGAQVTPLAVYERRPFAPDAALRERLGAAAQGTLASVISSSEAVDALLAVVAGAAPVLAALRAGPALAAHARIAERAAAAGFARVVLCAPEPAAIEAALREAGG